VLNALSNHLHNIDELTGCHVFVVRTVHTNSYICALTSCIAVFSYWYLRRTCYMQLQCWSNL